MDRNNSNDRTTAGVVAAIAIIATVALLALAGLGGVSCAAEGENAGGNDGEIAGAAVSAASVTDSINYQGRLTDSSTGEPLTGTYGITFRLYNVSTGGMALATDTHLVEVTDGLFNTGIDFGQSYFDGRARWLGVQVEADPEMTPRQELRSVPYALSLVPGAVINGSVSGHVLEVKNGADWGVGVYASTTGKYSDGVYAKTTGISSEGVYAYTTGKYSDGVYAKTTGIRSEGVRAHTTGNRSNGVHAYTTGIRSEGVRAHTTGDSSDGVSAHTAGDSSYGVSAYTAGDSSYGVSAYTAGDSSYGVYASTSGYNSYGVRAHTNGISSDGVYASTTGGSSQGVRAHTTGSNSDGVRAHTTGNDSDGVYASSAKSYGVFGKSDSTESAGVYALGKDGGADLILGGNANTGVGDDGKIYSDPAYSSSDIYLITNDGLRIDLDNNGDGEDADFEICDKNDTTIFNVDDGGNVGIGLTEPNRKLYVVEDVSGVAYPLKLDNPHPKFNEDAVGILFSTGGSGGGPIDTDRGKGALVYEYKNTWNRGSFHFLQEPNTGEANPDLSDAVMTIRNNGNVGIGTASPDAKLEVIADGDGDGVHAWTTGDNSEGVHTHTSGNHSEGVYTHTSGKWSDGVRAETTGDGGDGVRVRTYGNDSYGVRAYTYGKRSYGVRAYSQKHHGIYASTGSSDHKYGVKTYDKMCAMSYDTGCADVAEYFPAPEDPEPGTVMVIDPAGGSKLRSSTNAYDTTVAGIVSTAPGVSLGTKEDGNDGEKLIAVAGRVPCKVDASYAAIKPGDLLTTSDTQGHAMKATNPVIGTILGKALAPLDAGTGTIEVLVTLQ